MKTLITNRYNGFAKILIVATYFVLLSGCVQVPPQAHALVGDMTQQMRENEEEHLSLMNLFFERQRERVKDYIEYRWTPIFLETFFGDPANDQAWQSAIDADPDERLRYLQSTSTALVRAIDTERRALLQPLDTLEIQATQALRTRYTELYRSGAVLEEFLRSTSELATKGEHQLSDLGIDTTSIDQWIEESDHTITELLGLSNDITWQHEHLKAFLDRLNRLTESTHIEPTGE